MFLLSKNSVANYICLMIKNLLSKENIKDKWFKHLQKSVCFRLFVIKFISIVASMKNHLHHLTILILQNNLQNEIRRHLHFLNVKLQRVIYKSATSCSCTKVITYTVTWNKKKNNEKINNYDITSVLDSDL